VYYVLSLLTKQYTLVAGRGPGYCWTYIKCIPSRVIFPTVSECAARCALRPRRCFL